MNTIRKIFIDTFVPALIILFANVFGHDYGSERYEKITAIFGWIGGLFLAASIVLFILV
jgi:hypothetical protein